MNENTCFNNVHSKDLRLIHGTIWRDDVKSTRTGQFYDQTEICQTNVYSVEQQPVLVYLYTHSWGGTGVFVELVMT